jgi:hypothetical protein
MVLTSIFLGARCEVPHIPHTLPDKSQWDRVVYPKDSHYLGTPSQNHLVPANRVVFANTQQAGILWRLHSLVEIAHPNRKIAANLPEFRQ